jgi:hypothetical protein
MNAPSKKIAPTVEEALSELQPQLAKLREPFPPNQISKLPKETRAQIDARKASGGNAVMVFNCEVCGGSHHKKAVHLDYVGHAALTDRLLDTDLEWTWEPVGFTPEGLPALDRNGGLWIKLTVCGVTRYGYGAADGKSGGDAMKEMIGDALRNAAMRFGAALELWHKGDLHAEDDERPEPRPDPVPESKPLDAAAVQTIERLARDARVSIQSICERANVSELAELSPSKADSVVKKLNLTIEQKRATQAPMPADILDDEIPY